MNYRKLRKIDLAVLHCLNTSKDWIGKQPSAAIRRFFAVDDQFLFEVEVREPSSRGKLSDLTDKSQFTFPTMYSLSTPERNIYFDIHFSVPFAYYIARGIFMKKSLV